MRRKITAPTTIYWLVDVRPETLLRAPHGVPFYCGKTIFTAEFRLTRHLRAAQKFSQRLVSKRILACGQHLRVITVETVQPDNDWCARERHWIATLRSRFPNTANMHAGGDGCPGFIHSAEARARMSAAQRGRKLSAEHVEKIRWTNTGRKKSKASREKIGAAHRGKIVSTVTREKLRAANLGKTPSPETRKKISAAGKGRTVPFKARGTRTPDTREKIRRALLGKKHTAVRNAKRSAALKGRKLSSAVRARMCVAQALRRAAERAAHV